MQVATVSAEVAAQSAMVNRFSGSLRAWTFQVDSGQNNRQVFVFPIDMHGPDGTCSPLARNALDVHLVCSPEPQFYWQLHQKAAAPVGRMSLAGREMGSNRDLDAVHVTVSP